MRLTGGGALYSQTPESCLEVNELKENPPLFPHLQKQEKASIVREVSRSDGRFNKNHVILSKNCGEEDQSKIIGEGSESCTKILSTPLSWLLAINGSTGNAHRLDLSPSARNPLYRKGAENLPCKGVGTQCLKVLNNHVILNKVKNRRNEHKCLTQRFFEQSSQNDMGVNNKHVILSKNCGEHNQSTHRGEGSKKDPSPEFLNSHLFIKKLFPLPQGARDTRAAFTLAEVLVTLGIIGIVAAMTLPMLARNYNFYIRQQQFKKAYAALSIAVQKTQIDMGEGVRCFYKSSGSGQFITDCKWFYSELSKQLNIIKVCEGNALDKGCISRDMRGGEEVYVEVQGGDDPVGAEKFYNQNCLGLNASYIKNKNIAYVFNPGFTIMAYNADNNPIFLFDINALRGPNKWGHDIFLLRFIKIKNSDSVFTIKPVPGHSCHSLEKGGYYTETFMNYLYGRNAEL